MVSMNQQLEIAYINVRIIDIKWSNIGQVNHDSRFMPKLVCNDI